MKKLSAIYLTLLLSLPLFAGNPALDLRKNVEIKKLKRERGQEVCIEKIPHVKQRKNFCAPASCSMVLRYFDQRYNQKDLGKLFNSTRDSGTYTSDIYNAFNKSELSNFELVSIYALTSREINEMIRACNTAKNNQSDDGRKSNRSGKKQKRRRQAAVSSGTDFWNRLDPEVARRVLPVCRAPLKNKFSALCREFIDAGIPVMWSVSMTLDPHSPAPEGHMRVINGYVVKNGKLTHILYRDSWSGHSGGDSMSLDNAVAMTKHLFAIVPRGFKSKDQLRIKPLIKDK